MKNLIAILLLVCSLSVISCKKDSAGPVQLPEPEYGTITDAEGNVYKTVKIGDQIWMAENLRTHKLNNGTPIAYVTQTSTWSDPADTAPMMCYYDNDVVNNKDKYGALYNWYAVNTGKLAPIGWHVPSDADWQKLQEYLIANGYNFDGSKTENKIAKALASTSDWANSDFLGVVGNDQTSNNKSGFNGLPTGIRDLNGTFDEIGFKTKWWTTNETSGTNASLVGLKYDYNKLFTGGNNIKKEGYSVRCVKD